MYIYMYMDASLKIQASASGFLSCGNWIILQDICDQMDLLGPCVDRLWTSKVNPKPAHVKPETAQVNPKSAQVKPKSIQVNPKAAQVKPKTAQVNPKSAQVKPADAANANKPLHLVRLVGCLDGWPSKQRSKKRNKQSKIGLRAI